MKDKLIFLGSLIISLLLIFGILYSTYYNENNKELVFCAQDVKECSDGSFVSRNPNNNCEFDPCQEDVLIKCNPEERNLEKCDSSDAGTTEVCGWFDSEKINCIKYPCAQTFENSCEACKNENVKSWSEGKCPNQ